MSLVNQMLRDLEGRQGGAPLASAALLEGIGSVEESPAAARPVSRWRLPLVAGMLLALVLAVLSSDLPAALRGWLTPADGEFAAGAPGAAAPGVAADPVVTEPVAAGHATADTPVERDLPSRPAPTTGGAAMADASEHDVPVAERAEVDPTPSGQAPPLAGHPAGATGAAESAGAAPPSGEDSASAAVLQRRHGLRLALSLAAPPADPPPADAPPGKAALPADLAAVAARFDREFETASEGADGSATAASPAAAIAPSPAPRAQPPASTPAAAPNVVKTPVPASPVERAAALYSDARRALAAGDTATATATLRELLDLDPAHVEGRRLLAGALVAAGRAPAADALLAEGLTISPGDAPLVQMRARLLVELGRDAEALAVLEAAGPLRGDLTLQAFHAALMQRMGDHAGASAAYRRVLATRPGNGLWWMGLGISLEALAQPGEAREAFARARDSGELRADLAGFVEQRLQALGG